MIKNRFSDNWRWRSAIHFLAAVVLGSGTLAAAPAHPEVHPVGATVAEFLALAQKMNPERAAASLEAEAAIARAQGTGILPDPKFQFTLDDISKNSSGLPSRPAVEKYTVQQGIPWWGKRDLQRGIAEAESAEVMGKLDDVDAEIALRIKSAYAEYHRVHLSMDQTAELIQIMRTLVQFAKFRYAQGLSTQLDMTSAETERGALAVELVRLEKERSRIRSRLNALVNRKPDAPVVEHPHLRPLPTAKALKFDPLLRLALEKNPALTMIKARTRAAVGEQRLADKAWYPDVDVSFGLVRRRNEAERTNFEAMVGFDLPIQVEGRRARERETAAKTQAMQKYLAFEQLRIESALRETLLTLEEAREVARVTTSTLLPQAHFALQSALKGYQTGATESVAALDAVQRLKKFQIDLLKAEFDAQVSLAAIERLIGGDL